MRARATISGHRTLRAVVGVPKGATLRAAESAGVLRAATLKIVEAAVPKALKVAKPGTEKFRVALRDAIEGTKGLKGAGTVFTMTKADHTGINQLGMCVLKVENGKWKLEDHAEFK